MSDFEWSGTSSFREKAKQLLRAFEGWTFKKFEQFEGWDMGQVDHKKIVFWYIITAVYMPYSLIFWRVFVNTSKTINFLIKYPIKQQVFTRQFKMLAIFQCIYLKILVDW